MPHAPASIALVLVALVGCASPNPELDALPARALDRCAIDGAGEAFSNVDVAIAIDASTATSRPSGSDIDRDGTVGAFRQSVTTDRGDSLLAAQVAAVKSLVLGGMLPDARMSIVAYSGRIEFARRSTPASYVSRRVAVVSAALTSERAEVESALDRVLARGSRGAVDLAAAVQLSLRTLRAAADPESARRRVILLISNSPTPVLGGPTVANFRKVHGGDPNGPFLRDDPDLAIAARKAIRHRATIHTFGLGSAADAEEPHPLSRVARATGGSYRRVGDPGDLHCDLLGALAAPPGAADRGA